MDRISGSLIFIILIVMWPAMSFASPEFSEEFEVYLSQELMKAASNQSIYKSDIKSFYEARNYKPVWFDERGRALEKIDGLHTLIQRHAYENGLQPAAYNLDVIAEQYEAGTSADALFQREWMLTNTVMHYINDVRTGSIKPHIFDPMIFTLPQRRALDTSMEKFLKSRDKEFYLQTLEPPQPEYAQLKEQLSRFRVLQERGGWPVIDKPKQKLIRVGEFSEIIPQVRARLNEAYHDYDGVFPDGIWVDKGQIVSDDMTDRIASKNLPEDTPDNEKAVQDPALVYDHQLAKRVAEFQYFHGKKSDSVIGPETLAALNAPVSAQIDKIRLSMERWRWLPDDLGRKHVRVNIAAFYARAVENKKDAFVMPIIVGQVAHQTPVFSSVIKNVKIHPDWTSPDSIAARYVIPKIQRNPAVIHKLGYQIQNKHTGRFVSWDNVNIENLDQLDLVNYQFRQKPGNSNALGLARFSIDNDYAIFMHGTPKQSLFAEDDRTFSSGCVRLENPLVMAHFLLKDQGMPKSELRDLYYLEDGEFPDTTYIDLKEDVPVHLMYMTAWIDQKGYLHFADDAYGRDKKLKKAMVNDNAIEL